MAETIAITRSVSAALARCELTHLERSPIDVARARAQHVAYEAALRALGCRVVALPEEPTLPDSVFVEDTAVVLDEIAVLTRPGAASRRAEVASIADAVAAYRTCVRLEEPATLDGGDVLRLGRRLFVGLSSRSNPAGVAGLAAALAPFGYEVKGLELGACLHLKTAVTEAAPGVVLCNPAWLDPRVLGDVAVVEVDPAEPFAANVLALGGRVLLPAAFPRTAERLARCGLDLYPVAVDELAKAEGAVTCCSLVFRAGDAAA